MFVATLHAYDLTTIHVKKKGFGDGLKSAASCLIADSLKFKLFQFEFLTRDHITTWNFKGRPIEGMCLFIFILNISIYQSSQYGIYLSIYLPMYSGGLGSESS
jgi:hypothetical protein